MENVEKVDDNDGWEVPKTKKGKGPKKTEPVKGNFKNTYFETYFPIVEKNNGKKNTREAPREQPKKKVMMSNFFWLIFCRRLKRRKNL